MKKILKQNPDESTYNQLLKLVNKKVAILGDENYYGFLYGIRIAIGRTGYAVADKENFSLIYYIDSGNIGHEYILKVKDVKNIDGRKIILKSKPLQNPKRRKNPDQIEIRKQLEKFITLPGVHDYKKVVLMSDPYLFGKLEHVWVWEGNSPEPLQLGLIADGRWRLDKENLILVVRHQMVGDLAAVYSRSLPGIRETIEKYKFNINDIVRIDGRKIYLNKNPELVEKSNSGRRV